MVDKEKRRKEEVVMSRKPNLHSLDKFFKKGKDFELTDAEYERHTGIRLPKNKSYLLKRSALAKKCELEGFKISVVEKRVKIEKVTQ